MIVNGKSLVQLRPIEGMLTTKERAHGLSFGLSEAGYDIRIKQGIAFDIDEGKPWTMVDSVWNEGRFVLASTIERFTMPECLVGIVHDKSTWARQGLSVFNTVIEPGWSGNLTLELVFHGNERVIIPAGAGIAQVVFSRIENEATYAGGKYDNQEDHPVEARFA